MNDLQLKVKSLHSSLPSGRVKKGFQQIPSEKSSVSAAAKLNMREDSGCSPELTGQLLTVNLPPAANLKVSYTNAVDPKRKLSNENQQMTSNKSSTVFWN